MAQYVLRENGKVVTCHSIRCLLTPGELAVSNAVEAAKREAFTLSIQAKLGNSFSLPTAPHSDPDLVTDSELELYEDDSDGTAPNIPEADLVDATGKPFQLKSFEDTLINLEVLLPHDDGNALAKVLRLSVDGKGHFIGTYSDNPLWNNAVYDCEFADGTTKSYAANVIAESIYDGVDADGYAKGSSYTIIDHKSSGEAVKMEDKWFITKSGMKRLRQTTVSWSSLLNGQMELVSVRTFVC
jgi:hypothetical protein